MSRLFFVAVAAAATFASPAMAHDREFSRDGITFKYSVEQDGDTRILRGRASEGSTFRLTVRGDRVSGVFGASRVAFSVPASAKADVNTAI